MVGVGCGIISLRETLLSLSLTFQTCTFIVSPNWEAELQSNGPESLLLETPVTTAHLSLFLSLTWQKNI